MLTRKNANQELEIKLKAALKELKDSKQLCDQLLQEREEGEEEAQKIIQKNTLLKCELAELHVQYMDILEERNQLYDKIDSASQCTAIHDQALQRITDLERELHDSQNLTLQLESEKKSLQTKETLNLFEELLCSNHIDHSICKPIATIDLTSDNSVKSESQSAKFYSHNQLKKYLRLNRFIKRSKRAIKNSNNSYRFLKLKKENSQLIHKLKGCNSKNDQSRFKHELEVQKLQSKINTLQVSLHDINSKYSSAKHEINAHILALNEMLATSKHNADLFDTLVKNHSNDSINTVHANIKNDVPKSSHINVNLMNSSQQTLNNSAISLPSTSLESSCNQKLVKKTLIFSDEIGKGFSTLLSNQLNHQVLNYCSPGLPIRQLINKVSHVDLDSATTVIIIFGDGISLKKKDLLYSVETLMEIQNKTYCKLIFCGLPYVSNWPSEKNKYIFDMNMHLYNLTCRHSDVLFYLDLNKFIYSFKMTQANMYLPVRCRRDMATLLAYTIQCLDLGANKSIDFPRFRTIGNITNIFCDSMTNLEHLN